MLSSLDNSIDETFDQAVGDFETTEYALNARNSRDKIINELIAKHPESSEQLKTLLNIGLDYTAEYTAYAYRTGFKLGLAQTIK